MFVLCEGFDAVDVGSGIGVCESDPEEIAEGFGDELAVVDDDNQAEGGDFGFRIADCRLQMRGRLVWAESLTFEGEDPWENDAGVFEAVGELQVAGEFGGEFEARWADCGDYDFGARVKCAAGVIEGVDRGFRLEMEIAGPVGALEYMAEEGGNVVHVEIGLVSLVRNQ